MSDSQTQSITEQMNAAATLWTSTICNHGTDTMLSAHEEGLKAWDMLATEWLERRQEAGADARQLVTRLRSCRDVTEILSAQQEWYLGALRRLAADWTGWTPLATAMASAWWRQDEAEPGVTTTMRRPPGQAQREASASHLLAARAARTASQLPRQQQSGDANQH